MKIKIVSTFLTLFFIFGCASTNQPTLTPLEIQTLQTREYDQSKEIVFPSVISVLSDIGYTITSADLATGLITAESLAQSDAATKFWLGISNVSQTKANAFVEEIGEITKLRLNFVVTNDKSYGYGQTDRSDVQVLDATAYQNAFEKIENAIFVRDTD
ncbi:hypothetical protein N8080_03220 [Alphaproteobacteria bacterium]|nr:hypothetical protein [Alphaproteobacteria bacterium]